MNWLFRKWRRITVRVGDELVIFKFGTKQKIRITALTDVLVYYEAIPNGGDWILTHSELKERIIALDSIRTEVQI